MGYLPTCDQRDCPAPALHHIALSEQDFHFCHHHWVELAPSLTAFRDGPDTTSDCSVTDRTTQDAPAGPLAVHAGT